ncbi:MAG: NAD(P)-dependent glycerol-3-phosphate dehydrogenase [Rhodospirillales bacterium]|nr:NAD(P)-dependent glycerol-3-phosphate dehydrogenase [Rhodospirillales bacterium]
MQRVGVIGGGAWGTGLAMLARRAGRAVVLWAREREVVDAINRDHRNEAFLPGIALDPNLRATADAGEAVDADAVIVAAPAQHLRATLAGLAGRWPAGVPAVICAKGIERGTCALMSEVVAETLPAAPIAILSGPSFAAEVAQDLPTAVALASDAPNLRSDLPGALATPHFRIYSTDDVIGAQVGGAVKNVLAIACGIVRGRGMGDNARAALITRGLAETVRLAAAKGARAETLMGLSGIGDLVLTCTAMRSRNFSLGVALGEGASLADIVAGRASIAEGVDSAAAVCALADRHEIDMPICNAVHAVLNRGADLGETIANLLARPAKAEQSGW